MAAPAIGTARFHLPPPGRIASFDTSAPLAGQCISFVFAGRDLIGNGQVVPNSTSVSYDSANRLICPAGASNWASVRSTSNISAGDFTVAVLVERISQGSASFATVFVKGAGGSAREIGLWVNTTGSPNFVAVGGTGGAPSSTSVALAVGQKAVIALVRVGSTVTVYSDGKPCGTATNSATTATSADMLMGNESGTGTANQIGGAYDWLGVWTRALSQAELQSLGANWYRMLRY